MDTPSNDITAPEPVTPAQEALTTIALNTGDSRGALDTLADSEVLVPVPDDASEEDAYDPTAVALPVLEQPSGEQVVPVFTTEVEMADLLPFVSRYRVVPLGALASQWPDIDLSLTIDASSPHGLTLDSEDVRTLLARPQD
ncbi:SseB family protein [Streptomyces phyllanthi]|uniref:SseB family protein n=1 Tax=Streptomyces phyllanthi TaxID=1803180 RepID=A0A5N8WFB1_9ACTN|nr:SseB family protein [Streptomyces phyllanthi]MPY46173.1 SseB family protein [Streptomyces phyllanthi]